MLTAVHCGAYCPCTSCRAASSKQQVVEFGIGTWQHLASSGIAAVFTNTSGNVHTVFDGIVDPPTMVDTSGTWRAAAWGTGLQRIFSDGWYGITNAGTFALANLAGKRATAPALVGWPDLKAVHVLALAAHSEASSLCLVSAEGLGRCRWPSSSLLQTNTVHAVCLASMHVACFLDVYGDVRCLDINAYQPGSPQTDVFFTPPENELWVEIVCGQNSFCARATSGKLRCFVLLGNTLASPTLPSSNFTMIAAASLHLFRPPTERQRLCGIDTARRLRCTFAWQTGAVKAANL